MTLRIAPTAERAAQRLVELGALGIGGILSLDHDADGAFVTRAAITPTLAVWLRDHPGAADWQLALSLVSSLADACATCESRSLFPGPLTPETIIVRDQSLVLLADPLVHSLLHLPFSPSPISAHWLSPEQAAGATADNAGNRYALGLILYRLLAGEHPFASRGLRLALEDQTQRGAPPFPDAIASSLPPGLQSLTLRLLSPLAPDRPASAAAIATALRQVRPTKYHVPGRTYLAADSRPGVSETRTAPAAAVGGTGGTWHMRYVAPALGVLALVAGVAIAVWAVGSGGEARGAKVRARAEMTGRETEMEDCAGCHARESAEWSRSVMAHAVTSPLFESLEMLVEEQIGRERRCPDGAGVLRAPNDGACVSPFGVTVTGSGGAGWCVNCHAPGENLAASMPAWDARDPASRRALGELLPAAAKQGVSCVACHTMRGPARPGDAYQGNPFWISTETGAPHSARPEEARGLFGIANSGYSLDPGQLFGAGGERVEGGAHRRPDAGARAYLRSSEMCGACHDVRLFGGDAVSGEPFKRLRNGYTEWVAWSGREVAAGREPASCQDCHMSEYPGVCVPGDGDDALCPTGTVFAARAPGSGGAHYFTGVEVPLSPALDPASIDDVTLDLAGLPVGSRPRRDLLLARAVTLALETPTRDRDRLSIPVVVENVGAGHRFPGGFSQERELWLEVKVTDARGVVVYEAGHIAAADEDLHDKTFVRVTTDPDRLRGLFGADVADGRDAPAWTRDPDGTFRGRGLVNFQNGFLRCVRCIGTIDERGACQPAAGQGARRADRYDDGDYDLDTGECRSNLRGDARFLETYFPVGALDAERGVTKAPDAIIDTRSLAPGEPVRYVHELDVTGARAPFTVDVRLRFRAFPPYLLRAFIDYEAQQERRGHRPGGALIDARVLERLDIVDLASAQAVIP